MTQQQFIEFVKTLTKEQLLEKIAEIRKISGGRIPPEVQKKFRQLDDSTSVKEHFLATAFTDIYGIKTHVYEVRSCDTPDHAPVILNIHGGGWCLEHTERDIYFSRRLADRLHCLVIDVDYVLAPEYPYPAALEEIESLINALPGILKEWGGDTSRIVICGQSAGGNLSAAVMQRKNLTHPGNILGQIICYLPADNTPAPDNTTELTPRGETAEYYNFFYNEKLNERTNSDVSLVNATAEDLKDLPSTDIILAGLDNLMPDGKIYYELLKAHGVSCSLKVFENSHHGFLVNLYDEWEEGERYLVELLGKYFR